MTFDPDAVMRAVLGRLGLPDTPETRALLALMDQTVSRLDRSARILGVWIGERAYVDDLTDAELDAFEASTDRYATDMVSPEVAEGVLGTIDRCLRNGGVESLEFTSNATGRTLYLRGSCAPCGDDEVIWVTRDLTDAHEALQISERRAALEALVSDSLQALLDTDDHDVALSDVLDGVVHRLAVALGANAAYLRRFRGPDRVEIVGQWRSANVDYAPPGTSRAGGGYFPWASRQLMKNPILVVPDLLALGPEAAADLSSLSDDDSRGLVWIRIGPARRPTGLLGFAFVDEPDAVDQATYEPLVGFAGTALSLVTRNEDDMRRRLQHQVFEAITKGEPLRTVLAHVCRFRETGMPGQHCVIWLADDRGLLHPVGPASATVHSAGFDLCPDESPESEVFRSGRRCWKQRVDGADDLGPVAAWFGATAIEAVPLSIRADETVVGVLAVYDTSRLPLDPTLVEEDGWGEVAASLASVAIERIRSVADLSHRATHDALTGLVNRATFLVELDRAIAEADTSGRLIAVLYCDVDRFKELNDRFGHTRGDRFLVDVARLIRARTGPTDVVARLGGDEFAILLEGLDDENDAVAVAERVRGAIQSAVMDSDRPTTVSIGVAVSRSSGDHAEGLLRDADVAMYQAKSSGRDRVEMFAERFRREAASRDLLGRDLARALDMDQVEAYFQPMVDLSTGNLMGFEALARWNHPERGFVPPPEFIAIAEDRGMITALGDSVLRRSLDTARVWNGLDLHVNLSVRQIDTVGYADVLMERIAASGVPVDRVAMEITESVLLSESASTVDNLHRLTESGVGLVLDDFGTGYASLTYLRRFPFRGIKVDKSFVAGIEESADDSAIVSMVLALANSLGLEVIAEGVETEGQERRLREMGCRFVQGFRYSVPVAVGEVGGLISRFSASSK